MHGEWEGGKGSATRQGFNAERYRENYNRLFWWRKIDMGEFFDMTIGRNMLGRYAHIRLQPVARATIKEACECTDEELDEALKRMGQEMTDTAHADMLKMRERTTRQQAEQLIGLIAKVKEKKQNDPNWESESPG